MIDLNLLKKMVAEDCTISHISIYSIPENREYEYYMGNCEDPMSEVIVFSRQVLNYVREEVRDTSLYLFVYNINIVYNSVSSILVGG